MKYLFYILLFTIIIVLMTSGMALNVLMLAVWTMGPIEITIETTCILYGVSALLVFGLLFMLMRVGGKQ